MEILDMIVTIGWIVSLAVVLIAALVGLLGGLKKGALRAGVKLLTLVVTVALSLLGTLLLRDVFENIAMGFLPEKMEAYAELIELAVQASVAAVLFFIFWLVFTVVRLLMLFPQKLISRKLPRTFEEAMEASRQHQLKKAAKSAKVSVAVDAPVAAMPESAASPMDESGVETSEEACQESAREIQAEVTATAEVTEAAEVVASPAQGAWKRPLWYASAAICGMLSSVLLLGAIMMPVAGFATRIGDTVGRVTHVMEEEGLGASSAKIGGSIATLAKSPLFAVTDFFYGKTVFEPLTSFKTAYGKISLSDELANATDILCDLIPVAAHISKGEGLQDGDKELLTDAADQVTESKFIMSIGTFFVQNSADGIGEKNSKGKTVATQAWNESLSEVMEDMTPDALAEDIRSAVDLVVVMADSPILRNLLDENKDNDQPQFADLADREMMRGAFDVVYENDHAQALLVPMLNLVTEQMFLGMDVEPVYSDADLSDLSREEMAAEADRLCDAAQGLSNFADSVSQGQDVTDYRMTEAGKALDSLKESVVFGDQYEPMVRSVSAMGTKGENGENTNLVANLSDALVNGSSAENLMNAAQSVVTLGDELENGEKKGSENEKLMTSMDTLLNHTDEENAVALKGIAGDAFTGGGSTAEKNKLIGYFTQSVVEVSKIENVDIATEADAVQVMYDISHSEPGKVFLKISEKEMVELFLKSHVSISVLDQANNDNEDFGVWDKLALQERENILKAIKEADAKYDANKGVVATFFKLAWPQ